MGRRTAIALMVAGIAGCSPGVVALEGIEPFGPVRSAVWFDFAYDAFPSGHAHTLVMSDQPRLCKTLQQAQPTFAEADDRYFNSEPLSCDSWRTLLTDRGEASETLFGEGSHSLQLTFSHPFDAWSTTLEAGDYDHGFSGTSDYVEAVLHTFSGNPYLQAEALLDCDQAGWDAGDELDIVSTAWHPSTGRAELWEESKNTFRLAFEGSVQDEDGLEIGAIQASGTFRRCEIPWHSELLPWF